LRLFVPAGIVTKGPGSVAALGSEEERLTIASPAGAADERVIVANPFCPPTIVAGLTVNEETGGETTFTARVDIRVTPE
jgi:hypothetical protein